MEASPLHESPLQNMTSCLSPRKGSELNLDLFLILNKSLKAALQYLGSIFRLTCSVTFLNHSLSHQFGFLQYGFSILIKFELGILF